MPTLLANSTRRLYEAIDCGNVVPMSDDSVTMVNTVIEACTDTVPICLMLLSPKIHRKLFRLRSAVIWCTRSASVMVVEPEASAAAPSSKPPVPVQVMVRPPPSQTRPANTASVVGLSANCGHTFTVATAVVAAGAPPPEIDTAENNKLSVAPTPALAALAVRVSVVPI